MVYTENMKKNGLIFLLIFAFVAVIVFIQGKMLFQIRSKIQTLEVLEAAMKDEKLCSLQSLESYEKMLGRGIITSTQVNSTYQSEIQAIDQELDETYKSLGYQVKLSLKVPPRDAAEFFFTPSDLTKMKTYELVNGVEEEMSFADLSAGDTVAMRIIKELDQNKNAKIVEVVIVKLK